MSEQAPAELQTQSRKSVLIPHRPGENPYIRELARAYADRGFDVECDRERLHSAGLTPDLIHLQWPEEHYRWSGGGTPEALSARFVAALRRRRDSGVRIAWTVHNLAPHEHRASALDRATYQEVLNASSVLVHHCEVSRVLLRERYSVPPTVREVVEPHGAYFTYPGRAEKQDARTALDLPAGAFVFLAFGNIRAYKGLDLLLSGFRACRVRRKYLVVAGLYVEQSRRQRIRLAFLKRLARNMRFMLHAIPEDEVQPLVAASDAVVLSHLEGLNSGVAVLGMTFGRPVVGPRVGCIPSVLEQGMNVLYEPGRVDALARAMDEAATLDLEKARDANVAAAKSWTWHRTVDAVCRQAW